MDNTEIGFQATADTAQAEKQGELTAAELGKFKDVRALLEAYNSLQAEFTRRSQRLKELENANKEVPPPAPTTSGQTPSQGQTAGESPSGAAEVGNEIRERIIAEYLAGASKNRAVPFITGGVNVPAQRRAPATVKEAGLLAEQFLNKREN